MTRGQIRFTAADGKVYGSTEFNGSMAVKDYGSVILSMFLKDANTAEDFISLVHSFSDAYFHYDSTEEEIAYEITPASCQPCPHQWSLCAGPKGCPEFDTCERRYFTATEDGNVYNIVKTNGGLSDFLYWLNRSDEDICVFVEEGEFLIPPNNMGIFCFDTALGAYDKDQWEECVAKNLV